MLCVGLFAAEAAPAAHATTAIGPARASRIDHVLKVDFACKLTSHGLVCGSTKGGGSQKSKGQGSGGKGEKGGKLVAARSMACPGAVVGMTVCQTCPSGSVPIAMTCNYCPPGTTFAGDAFHCAKPKK
jgi:hypothetical protein